MLPSRVLPLIAVLACVLIDPSTTAAQTAADSAATVRLDMPAQPLQAALEAFASHTGIVIEANGVRLESAGSKAVSGDYQAAQALRLLIEGTGLRLRFRTAAVAELSESAAAMEPVYSLTPLLVIGERSGAYVTQRSRTATRTDTPILEVPQALNVVTKDVIRDQAMQGMTEVIRYVPGATMGQGEGHRDAPTMRGTSSTADFYVDGMRDDAQYLRDLYNVERVEALKGPNAMVFGRGGGGGIVNRVIKEPKWLRNASLSLVGGSHDKRRVSLDLGDALSTSVAFRLNSVVEDSRGFRTGSDLRRIGVNPAIALMLGERTTARAGFEYFADDRTVDRGVPSYQGRPSDAPVSTFFGNPGLSSGTVDVRAFSAGVSHAFTPSLTIDNRTRYVAYDKFYQNSYPAALNAGGTEVTLAAYNSATDRRNIFNQTDVTFHALTGSVLHTVAAGFELGHQRTENFRNTGYYTGTSTTISVPFAAPTVSTPIEFRQSASDADNNATATVAAGYVQDQLAFSERWLMIAGARYEYFDLRFDDNRSSADLSRADAMISPRAGLLFKPAENASLYASYSVSFLPGSGDQFSSLTATSQTLKPEQFTNYEIGAKWDARPTLSFTVAGYSLDRSKTTAPDPKDPTRRVQTGSQRTMGVEFGATGSITDRWHIVGGLAFQRAEITSTTASAPEGATPALVPERALSVWNRFQLRPWLGVGVGYINQAEMFASLDDTVTLPAFSRVDGAVFMRLSSRLGAQVNIENLADEQYYPTSHGNNNIMPGAPRSVRFALMTSF
jgi:catecholate siderophore receptor